MTRKPRKTDLKFTQSEVRHVVCLLYRNREMPRDLTPSFKEEWRRRRLCATEVHLSWRGGSLASR